jgi:hypothetical protein
MDTPRISSASARHISVDWSLIAITVVAMALLVSTMVRTGPEHVPGTPLRSGGLEVLGADETLVAFEDFSFGAQGWTAMAERASVAATPVFGPFEIGTVGKDFLLPEGTARVRIGFDMHLPEAAGGFYVRLNGQSVIENAMALAASNAVVERRDGADGYTVWILLEGPGDAVSLEVGAEPGPNAGWAIDNVSVIASGATS